MRQCTGMILVALVVGCGSPDATTSEHSDMVRDLGTDQGSTMATKSQHSQFANYVLPTQFFNDPPSVVIPLIAPDKVTPGGRDVLVQLWEAASEFSTDNGGDSPDLGAIVSGIAGPYISLVVFPALGAFFAWGAAKLGD